MWPQSRPYSFTLRQASALATGVADHLRHHKLPHNAPPLPNDPTARLHWLVNEMDAARGSLAGWPKDGDQIADGHAHPHHGSNVRLVRVLGVVLARPLGRALAEPPWVAAMLVIGAGLIVSYTLTPRSGASWASIAAAPTDRTGLDDLVRAPWHWWPVDARTLNVLLFIPLGFAIAFIGRRWLRWVFIACAVLAPFAIEGVQLMVSRLDRLPQWVDVVDNITGLVLGLLLGLVVARLASSRPR